MAAVNAIGDFPRCRMRFYALARAAEQAGKVPGNAYEVGCFRGLSAYIAADVFRGGKEADLSYLRFFRRIIRSYLQ
jgi:hypothetical protein